MATILGAYKIQYFTTYFYFIIAVFYDTLLVINIVTISHVYSVIHCYIGAIADRSVCQLSKRIALLSMHWVLILLFFMNSNWFHMRHLGNVIMCTHYVLHYLLTMQYNIYDHFVWIFNNMFNTKVKDTGTIFSVPFICL